MGQKFQYDESGSTFFYFLLSFLALILIPATLYYWPRKNKRDSEEDEQKCQCTGCVNKNELLKNAEPWKGPKIFFIKLLIVFGWVLLILLAYKVSQFDYEMSNFDPYEILGVPLGSSQADIRKAYRKLSLILHPDKDTGDEKEFMKLSKAYQALTDDEARRNWEKYGNPDGPGAMSFGIALPSWIVEKENSVWVLGLYALVFMVALPTAVGTWWYRSIKFTGDQVLLDTTQLYYYFFHKSPSTHLKRVLMILAASLEFDKKHNSEIQERHTDKEEIQKLIKDLPNLGEKNKERPLCFMYSIKARAILHAHLSRIPLNPETLNEDRLDILKKCPYLIQEQVNCVNQLIMLAYNQKILRLPTIGTIENCMKLCPMLVQGLWDFKSPLLQLPYFTDLTLRHFSTKRRQIKTVQQYAQLKSEERRSLLRNLSDFEYENVMKVLGDMPYIDFQVNCEVMDDDNPNVVTAGALVTVTVTLARRPLSSLFGEDDVTEVAPSHDDELEEGAEDGTSVGGDKDGGDAPPEAVEKRPAWLKQKRGGGGKKKQKSNKQKPNKQSQSSNKIEEPSPKVEKKKDEESVVSKKDEDGDSDGGVDSDVEDTNNENDKSSEDESVQKTSNDDDDQEWERFRKLHDRERSLEGRSKQSHSVHSPLFPSDKQEYWWTYICDRKSRTLLTTPFYITNLVHKESVQLKFTAPNWPGVYTFTCCLRSDSYLGFDQQKDIKLDVKEAPAEITEHPQWEFEDSEDEKEVDNAGNESEYTTDDDLPEEEN